MIFDVSTGFSQAARQTIAAINVKSRFIVQYLYHIRYKVLPRAYRCTKITIRCWYSTEKAWKSTYLKENLSQNALRGVFCGATGYETWYFLILFSVTNSILTPYLLLPAIKWSKKSVIHIVIHALLFIPLLAGCYSLGSDIHVYTILYICYAFPA